MDGKWTTVLKNLPTREPMLWVLDTKTQAIVDITPATAAFLASHARGSTLRTLSTEHHTEVAQSVARTGRAQTVVEWMNFGDSWRKLARTSSHVGGSLVMIQSLDVTQFDPRAEWLARINLVSQRLELDSGTSISFAEFVVLHLLLKGLKYKRIAEKLNITTKTVDYRISRLKIALGVETTEDMLMEVSASGLIYLALIPIDLANPAQTETELYKKVLG